MNVAYIHLESVDSTNTWAKENHSHFDLDELTCITTSEQTAGRGRFNRRWISPKGVNLHISYFFKVEKGVTLNNLSQLLCLSVVKLACEHHLSPKIKWPNDILVNGKKISGVLCEIVELKESAYGVIAGVGININMSQEDLSLIDEPASSFLNETGKLFPLKPLLTLLSELFVKDLTLYLRKGFAPFYQTYNSFLTQKGKKITLSEGETLFKGLFHSMNRDGTLNLLLDSGEIKTFSTADTLF